MSSDNQLPQKKPNQVESEWQEYVRILERDERDVEGKLLKHGARVLCHPLQPEAIREDNPVNRQEFLRFDRTWTPQVRQRIWLPPLSEMAEDLADQTECYRLAKKTFLSAIDENVVSARQQPIPEVKTLPIWFAVLAWEPKIKEVVEVADLTEQLTDHIAGKSGTPQHEKWPDEWRQWLASLNVLKVYALSGMTTTVHVIAAVPACVQFETPGRPSLLPPRQDVIDLVYDIYQEWSHSNGHRAAFMFFTIASAQPWPEQITGHAAGDYWVVVSSLNDDGSWQTTTPPRFADRLSLSNFLDRLRPETQQQRISKIKQFVDAILDSPYEGTINLEMLFKKLPYRRTTIRDAMLTLQERGDYRVYLNNDGIISVGRTTNKIGKTVTAGMFRRGWLVHMSFLVPAVSVGVWIVKDLIVGRPFEVWSAAAMIPLAYGGEWLSTRFRKLRKD